MNTHLLVKIQKILSAGVQLLLITMFLIGGSSAFAAGRISSEPVDAENAENAALRVGTVNMLLGKAYVETPEYGREKLHVGSVIQVGDLITTTTNGHVHIQFNDNAYVSVRPNSRLEIIRYDFNPEYPELSAVKFDLKGGVARSISGQAAKSARDQFRLNTPIAAIGVRGTDFVISATDNTVRALVNEGLIVMAPFSDACRADAFGPCSENAVELAGQSMQILELNGIASVPQLLPAPLQAEQLALQSEFTSATTDVQNDSSNRRTNKDELSEIATLARIAAVAESEALQQPEPTRPTVPSGPDFTPKVPVTVAVASQRQLVWGRYSFAAQDQDRISLSFAEASADRQITVGNLEYGLFRSGNADRGLDKGLGVVSFQLNSAQAFYDAGSGVVAMQVKGGNLAIDFQQNNFTTGLKLDHALTGPVDFFASGGLFDGGHFFNSDALQRIAGSVSFDGKEAGYLFEKNLDKGKIQGLTLWDKRQ